MNEEFSYQDYVTDETFLRAYNEYQARYAEQIRESDKVIIRMVKDIVASVPERRLRILDIGCSTGNLLLHLKRMIPDADYVGGDLAESSLKVCRENSELNGVRFERMDILDLTEDIYDIVIANAVAVYFSWPEYVQCLKSVYKALRDSGSYIIFEWIHPYSCQDLTIYETSIGHPDGIRICFRPISKVSEQLENIGFSKRQFFPFTMPFDLEQPGYDDEVTSYTRMLKSGERLTFRGALYQPWCHVVARKP